MASETEAPEIPSLFESSSRNRDLYFILPFILSVSNNDSNENPENPDRETSSRSRTILINPFTQATVVIEGDSNLEPFLIRQAANEKSQPPASKASIEAMPRVKINETEGEDEDGECVVCLEEWKTGDVAKKMPCKHKFHDKCIEMWLVIHGTCPVCRYKMPVDEEETRKKSDEERREIWVSLSFDNGSRRSEDFNQVLDDNEI